MGGIFISYVFISFFLSTHNYNNWPEIQMNVIWDINTLAQSSKLDLLYLSNLVWFPIQINLFVNHTPAPNVLEWLAVGSFWETTSQFSFLIYIYIRKCRKTKSGPHHKYWILELTIHESDLHIWALESETHKFEHNGEIDCAGYLSLL